MMSALTPDSFSSDNVICVDPHTRNTLTNGNQSSLNWGGGMLVNNTTNVDTFYDAEVEFSQTAFDYWCTTHSAYVTWVGIGGWNSRHRLIQAGTIADYGTDINNVYPFYEAVDLTGDT